MGAGFYRNDVGRILNQDHTSTSGTVDMEWGENKDRKAVLGKGSSLREQRGGLPDSDRDQILNLLDIVSENPFAEALGVADDRHLSEGGAGSGVPSASAMQAARIVEASPSNDLRYKGKDAVTGAGRDLDVDDPGFLRNQLRLSGGLPRCEHDPVAYHPGGASGSRDDGYGLGYRDDDLFSDAHDTPRRGGEISFPQARFRQSVGRNFPFSRGGLLVFGFLLSSAVLGGGIFYLFAEGDRGMKTSDPPVVYSDAGQVRVAPSDPGGIEIPNQEKLVYDSVAGDERKTRERMVPREEQVSDPELIVETHSGNKAMLIYLGPVVSSDPPPSISRSKPEEVSRSSPDSSQEPAPAQASGAPQGAPLRGGMPEPHMVESVQVPEQRGAGAGTDSAFVQGRNADVERQDVPLPNVHSRSGSQGGGRPGFVVREDARAGQGVGRSGFVVQLSAQRSEEGALSEYAKLQGRFSMLQGYKPLIQRVDLGNKGIYYRLQVGPVDLHEDAVRFCQSLKSAGLDACLVRQF